MVLCKEECSFDLKSFYTNEYELPQDSTSVYRWGGTSTNIFKYRVPASTQSGGETGRWTIEIDPEFQFEQFSVYLSIDSHFNLIEEKQEAMIFDDALIIQQTKQSANWCVNCDVYVILETVGDRRVYIKTEAVNFNPEIDDKVPIKAAILRNQFECFAFNTQEKTHDLVFTLSNFQGHLDAVLAPNYQPSSRSSSKVKLASMKQSPRHTVLARAVDRTYWNALEGNYYLCGQAYSASTLTILAEEIVLENTYSSGNGRLVSFWLYADDFMNFELKSKDLKRQNLTISVELGIYTQTGDVHPIETQLLYQLCMSEDCSKTINDASF